MNPSQFDSFAADYDAALDQGLSVTGEGKDYFARERLRWLSRCLHKLAFRPTRVLDYGCGTGSASPFLLEELQPSTLIGIDTSEKSLEVARRNHPRAEFFTNRDYPPAGDVDLVYCNGVFHHIPPALRLRELGFIFQCLRPGGIFALWENNPWNPGTRYVMSRIPFDRDAITISPLEARALVRASGFKILRTDHRFFFPSWLSPFRPLESLLAGVPLGGQYQVLCLKPPRL